MAGVVAIKPILHCSFNGQPPARGVGYTILEDPWPAPWPSSPSSTLPSTVRGRRDAYMIPEDPWPSPWPSRESSAFPPAAGGRSVSVFNTTHEDLWPAPWPEYTSSTDYYCPASPSSGQSVVYKMKRVNFFGRLRSIVLPSETAPNALIAICNILLLRGEIDLDALAVDVSPAHLLYLIAKKIIDFECHVEVIKIGSIIVGGVEEEDIVKGLDDMNRSTYSHCQIRELHTHNLECGAAVLMGCGAAVITGCGTAVLMGCGAAVLMVAELLC